jgi:hypothetical protein
MLDKGWIADQPAYVEETARHTLIEIAEGDWWLRDECWLGMNRQSGHVQMTWQRIPVFTATYEGDIYKDEVRELVRQAITAGYENDDFFGFRGPEKYPPNRKDVSMYYSNLYLKKTLPFQDFTPEYRAHDGIGEEAVCLDKPDHPCRFKILGMVTWLYRVYQGQNIITK